MKNEVGSRNKPQGRIGSFFAADRMGKTPHSKYHLLPTNYQIPNTRYQSGSIALYLVMIVAILLMTTTTIAARLSVSELSQSGEVDISDAAYYAAEAGIEEASRRLDLNDDTELSLAEIFPEQFENGINGGDQHGDRAVLVNDDGDSLLGSNNTMAATVGVGGPVIETDHEDEHGDHFGRIAWRQRKVYEEPINPLGTLVKDETVELDTTDLRRECPEGSKNYEGADGLDCDGSSIFDSLDGVEFCWSPTDSSIVPEIELTTVSYPSGNVSDITTEKQLISGFVLPGGGSSFITVNSSSDPEGVYGDCVRIDINDKSRRYIFRIRPLHSGASYRTELIDAKNGVPGPLFIANNTVIIDSIGQVGDVRRRIIARKERNGRILGIFDYVLYSGSNVLPLCKPGVSQDDEPGIPGVQYNLDNCTVVPAIQSDPSPLPPPSAPPSPSPTPTPPSPPPFCRVNC